MHYRMCKLWLLDFFEFYKMPKHIKHEEIVLNELCNFLLFSFETKITNVAILLNQIRYWDIPFFLFPYMISIFEQSLRANDVAVITFDCILL